jgi:hypothetical protein
LASKPRLHVFWGKIGYPLASNLIGESRAAKLTVTNLKRAKDPPVLDLDHRGATSEEHAGQSALLRGINIGRLHSEDALS